MDEVRPNLKKELEDPELMLQLMQYLVA